MYETLAGKIDHEIMERNVDALKALIAECEHELENANTLGRVHLLYYKANAHSGISSFLRTCDEEYDWSWNQSESVAEILTLRRALKEPGFSELETIRQCQIKTNLANSLSSLGRSVEAIELWREVLRRKPNFAMALGNCGIGISKFSQCLYDPSHAMLLAEEAENHLTRAIGKAALWDSGHDPSASAVFEAWLKWASDSLAPVRDQLDFDRNEWSIGEEKTEIKYREWCLEQRLFLNPLNDIMTHPLAANDVLHLPSHVYKVGETPMFPLYYNHLKQEYVSARYRLYSSIEIDSKHAADQDVLLLDGHDGAMFGHRSDQLKLAFRSAFSLFDKIAVFLNDYFRIGLKPRDTEFRRVFSQQVKGGSWAQRPAFEGTRNLPLRGLYYLSKDLFDPEFKEVSEPDANALKSLRDRAEHRFLFIRQYAYPEIATDEYTYVSFDEFSAKTLRLMRLVRAALTYLSLAMHVEEQNRASAPDRKGPMGEMRARPIE